MKHLWLTKRSMFYFMTVLLFMSCIEGYKDDWTFSSGVEGVTLESPDAEGITWTVSPEGTSTTVKWPVVLGAGGYHFNLYNVDDSENPVELINQDIDGCRVTFDINEDTKYLVSIKSLGNVKANNQEAPEATTKSFDTYIVGIPIPPGDLTAYFTNTPHTASGTAYELEGGAEYTISGAINLGSYDFILLGNNKENHAKVTVAADAKFVTAGAGLKIKFIDFDLSASKELISYDTPDAAYPLQGSDNYSVLSFVVINSCKFNGIKSYWVKGTSATYVIPTFSIDNCVFAMEQTEGQLIRFDGKGYINHLKISNSTLSQKKGGLENIKLIQYGNGDIEKSGYMSAGVTLLNNTFYNITYADNIVTYNMLRPKKTTITVTITAKENIFLDCGNQQVIKRLAAGVNQNGGPLRVCDKNDYWYNGAFPATEIGSDNTGDESGTHFGVDPGFADPDNGDFTISNSELINARIGDPRWFTGL